MDRDGVINQTFNGRPPNSPEELILLPGAAAGIRLLHAGGFALFVITNQGGVGLGYMGEEDLGLIHAELRLRIELAGGKLTEIAACTHKPSAGCACRKPQPGLLFKLGEKHGISLSKSYLVGDQLTDIEAGRAAGLVTILLASDLWKTKKAGAVKPDHICPDLFTAAELILRLD